MNKEKEKKYWIKTTTMVWVIVLIVTFLALFPAFVSLLVLWVIGKVQVIDYSFLFRVSSHRLDFK